ncbi:MAG: response regulator transcription factor [Chloroflexi bacterium]|nr:response regulator transcription factor [Chloroflexota bacterium]
MASIRVFLVDDHEVVREGFRRMLEFSEDVTVVGDAANGEEAIPQVEELQPDVVLMDIKMPRMDGIETTRQLKARFPDINIIVLTFFEDEYLVRAIEAGAVGYLLKDVSKADLLQAVRKVVAGQSLVDPVLSRKLFSRIAALAGASGRPVKDLSPREIQLLRAIARGLTNLEIADDLNLSESSVKRGVRAIFAKLKVRDRSQAVAEASRRHLI